MLAIIASIGHSRNGNNRALAAAFDDRHAMAISSSGRLRRTAPSRRKRTGVIGQVINDHFPHWFNG